MLKMNHIETYGWEAAIRGMRNPMNSWKKSDSNIDTHQDEFTVELGLNDWKLLKQLTKRGTDHRKVLRQIMVSFDVTAPLYWFKEFDTYKVATTSNSTSTMHKIHTKEFTLDDFSHDQLDELGLKWLQSTVDFLEGTRQQYKHSKLKEDWYTLIQLLPSSYNQTRTVTMNYEVALNMYFARKDHKLNEWHTFCEALCAQLPYFLMLVHALEGEDEDA